MYDSEVADMDAAKGSELLELLELPPFILSKVGSIEQAVIDWRRYVKSLNRVLSKTEDDGVHTARHIDCQGCKLAKDVLVLLGKEELGALWSRKLENEVKAMLLNTKDKKVVTVDCVTCTRPTHGEGDCPARNLECFDCGKIGYFRLSKTRKKMKKAEEKKVPKSRRVEEPDVDSDSEVECSYRVKEVVKGRTAVRAVSNKSEEEVTLTIRAVDSGTQSKKAQVEMVVDTGVSRTLISEEAWKLLKPHKGDKDPRLKINRRKFVPFGANGNLECIGRSKALLVAEAGASIETIVYVIRGVSECLLGKTDAVKLGIITFRPEGAAQEVRKLSETMKKNIPEAGQVVSAGMNQSEIDVNMESIVKEFSGLFEGFGRVTGVDPIHIEVDESVKPVQQKRRPIPLKYVERFESLLDDLKSKKVVSGPLDHKSATGWIHNPVISEKRYNNKIRLTLDTHPMAKAVKTAKFPIPTPTELRSKLRGSNRFSTLDMADSFFQFEMDEESSKHYMF